MPDLTSLPIKIEYVGKVQDKEWPHFLYNVTITHKNGFFTLPYKCGLGHVIKCRRGILPDKPKAPTNKDVVYSLLMDSSAADENFADWCDNYGYDSDSIKALGIYNECCKTAVNLRKTFTSTQLAEMREELEDY